VSETSEYLLSLMSQAADVAGARVEARFAHLFLALAAKVGTRENGRVAIKIRLARQDLADLTGTTVETSIRLMRRWHQQGLVTTKAGGFVIRDLATLELLRHG
jgi:CRP-like cAMP-binding protein